MFDSICLILLQASIDTKLRELLGERTAEDDVKVPKKKKEKPAKVEEKAIAVSTPEQPAEEILNPYAIFPQPEENFKVIAITISCVIMHSNYFTKLLLIWTEKEKICFM